MVGLRTGAMKKGNEKVDGLGRLPWWLTVPSSESEVGSAEKLTFGDESGGKKDAFGSVELPGRRDGSIVGAWGGDGPKSYGISDASDRDRWRTGGALSCREAGFCGEDDCWDRYGRGGKMS